MRRIIATLVVVWTFGLPPLSVAASDLPESSDAVILIVEGNIRSTNGAGRAQFDREMLSRLGSHHIHTSTPWTDGVIDFEGVLFTDLLAAVDAQGTALEATALNDYTVTIDVADLQKYPVIIAMSADGKPLTRRDKGPLWVIYPLDDHPDIEQTGKLSNMIWQLNRIVVQ
ncbi:MAG: hypothetical protein OEQ39_05850 [Gammaproteobacteria bacterium]|nr:hypothetical protein [Gammaproteobacteria bacterium]MDH3464558.1 hypothetical protein [Gammaproteobacteria bacterium]